MSGARLARRVAALVVGALAVLAPAAPASAHAGLVSVTPTAGSVAADAPAAVQLRFSEPIEVADDSIRVTDPAGRPLPGAATRDPAAANTAVLRLPATLARGTFAVRWHVVSIDGHRVAGEFRFAHGRPSTPLVVSAAKAPEGPSVLGGVGRALAVSGTLALLGLLLFPLVVRARPELAAEVRRRLGLPALVAAAAGVAGTAIVAVDTAAGSPFLEFLTGSRTGLLLGGRVVALLAAAALVAARRRLLAASMPALAAVATIPFASHAAAATADRPLAIGLDLLHLLAAALWAGGLLALGLAGLPAAREVGGRDSAAVGALAARLSVRFSTAAQLAMLVLLATGGYAALLHVSALSDLGRTSWGVALVVKLALFATVLLFALAGAVTFVPALAGKAGAAARRLAAVNELRSAIRVELGLAGALLAVTAVLAATAPPTPAADGGPLLSARTSDARGTAHGFAADVHVSRRGDATVFTVALTTEGTAASAPTAGAVLTGADGLARTLPLALTAEGRWTTEGLAVTPGTYQLNTRFDRLGHPVEIPVTVAVPR